MRRSRLILLLELRFDFDGRSDGVVRVGGFQVAIVARCVFLLLICQRSYSEWVTVDSITTSPKSW